MLGVQGMKKDIIKPLKLNNQLTLDTKMKYNLLLRLIKCELVFI